MYRVFTRKQLSKGRGVRRRSFLKNSVVGGLGASLVFTGNQSATAAVDPDCGFRLSAVEALTMFSELLFRIQSDSFNLLPGELERVAVDCRDQFKKLCESVAQLEVELRKVNGSKRDPGVEQMKVLAELGCSSATNLVNSPSQDPVASLKTLEGINKAISLATQHLLPEGETVLNAEATRLLRVILAQVHESAAIQRSIDTARKTTKEAREIITQGTLVVRRLMFEAGNEILIADDGNSTESKKARQQAVKLLGQAHEKLTTLIGVLKARQLYSDASPGDLLLLVLEGTKQWVDDPASVNASASLDQDTNEVRFQKIGVVETNRTAAPVIGFDPRQVAGLLKSFCPPDGAMHLSQVLTSMNAVKGWKVAMLIKHKLGWRGPVTSDEVLGAVKSTLYFLRLSCRPHRNVVPDPERLAQGLARML